MDGGDALRDLLIEFFELPRTTRREKLTQEAIAKWDSLAMVQLITELQLKFKIDLALNEIEHLGSYADISDCLRRKGALRNSPTKRSKESGGRV
jgi:acyl carrier protein